MDLSSAIRFVFGFAALTILPGFALSYAFFPRKEDLDPVERLATIVLLSISVVPLMIYYSNKVAKVPITIWSNLAIILVVTAIGGAFWFYRARVLPKRK